MSMATNAATNMATKCQAGSDKYVYAVNHFLGSFRGKSRVNKIEPYPLNYLFLVQPKFDNIGMNHILS